MKEILLYFRQYFQEGDRKVLIVTTLLLGVLVSINYTVGIEPAIKNFSSTGLRLTAFFFLYAFIFTVSYAIQFLVAKKDFINKGEFLFLLLICPLLFALKIAFNISDVFNDAGAREPWDRYWQIILNWPVKCIFMLLAIYVIWYWHKYGRPVAGLNKNFNWKPYLLLLLYSIPLLAVASSMEDFQGTYPRVKHIAFIFPYTSNDLLAKLAYELSYGTDFLTMELFFRGFVVLAFVRYVGKDAILPMAAFYCTIHFGKPLFECITSYIGGIMLGVIVYNTRSIWGGVIVHLGMAWLLEILVSANQ